MVVSKLRSTPSKEQCKIGAKLAIENAECHYRCAKHLCEIKEFGNAQSHLILGAEEAIKSVFLYLKGLEIPIRQNILDKVLIKHKSRHEIGGLLYLIFTSVMWAVNIFKTALENAIDKTEAEIKQIRNTALQRIMTDLQKSVSTDNSKSELNQMVTPLLEWWETADSKKKAGFYVDFQKGIWTSPQLIKREDYLKSLRIANDVIQNIKKGYRIIESFTEKERSDMIKTMKRQYKEVLKSYKIQKAGKDGH